MGGVFAVSVVAGALDRQQAAQFAVRIERMAGFTTSDGIQLVADIYHPQRAGPKTPTILVRLPYSKNATNKLFATVAGRMWAERGYTVVLQGTRGRYESGGDYYPRGTTRRHRDTRLAGPATVVRRPPGYVGLLVLCLHTVGAGRPQEPRTKVLLIQECSTDMHGMFYHGGAFSLKDCPVLGCHVAWHSRRNAGSRDAAARLQ